MKRIAALIFAGLTLTAMAATITTITSVEEKVLEKSLEDSQKKSIAQTLDETYEELANDALVFESGDNKGEISVEVNGVALRTRPGKCKFKNIVLRTSEAIVKKKVVVRGWDVRNTMIIETSKDDLLRLRTTRSIKISDANLVDCKGCPEIYAGYSHKGIITTRDSGRKTFRGGPREAGSGLATGKRSYTGGRKVEVPDEKLVKDWMNSFSEVKDKRMSLEFNNLDQETIDALKAAKHVRVKVKFPWLTNDVESSQVTKVSWSHGFDQSTMIVEFAIKENGIK